MTATEVATAVVSAVLLLTRFLDTAKPVWWRLPRTVAVLIPPVLLLVPQITGLIEHTKGWGDLIAYILPTAGFVVSGLLPPHPPKAERKSALLVRRSQSRL